MATRQIESWNETPAANNFAIEDGGAPGGHKRTLIDDSQRERMSALSSFYQDGIEWLDLLREPTDRSIAFVVANNAIEPITKIDITSGTNDISGLFNVGRRLQTTSAGVTTGYVGVLSVSYTNPTTVVTIYSDNGDTVPAGTDGLLLNAITTLGRLAFADTIATEYITLGGFTDTDFANALIECTANGGGTILLPVGTVELTQTHDIPTGCRLLGQGIGISRIDCIVDTVNAIFTIGGSKHCQFESFSLLGTIGGTGDGHGFHLVPTFGSKTATFREISIEGINGDGIKIEVNPAFANNAISDVIIDGLRLISIGGNGISCADINTSATRCVASNITINNFGFDSSGGEFAGLNLAGEWNVSNVSISGIDNPTVGRIVGIVLPERLATAPNEQDARHTTISNYSITSSAQDVRGIDMNGRFCSLVGGSIELTGAGSVGVRFSGTLGQQQSHDNKVVGVTIRADIGIDEPATPAHTNMVSDCIFDQCAVDCRIGGLRTTIQNNIMRGATLQSIQLVAGSVRARITDNEISDNTGVAIEALASDGAIIKGNSIYNTAGHGISAAAASTQTYISGNHIDIAGGDGISAAGTSSQTDISGNHIDSASGNGVIASAGALNVQVHGNRCVSIGLLDYVNSAGAEGHFMGNFPRADEVLRIKTADTNSSSGSLLNISGLTGIEFPAGDGGPDGFKTYVVDLCAPWNGTETGGGTFTMLLQLRMGANGDTGSAEILRNQKGIPFGGRSGIWSVPGWRVTPNAGDKIGMTQDHSSITSPGNALRVYGSTSGSAEKSWIRIRREANET